LVRSQPRPVQDRVQDPPFSHALIRGDPVLRVVGPHRHTPIRGTHPKDDGCQKENLSGSDLPRRGQQRKAPLPHHRRPCSFTASLTYTALAMTFIPSGRAAGGEMLVESSWMLLSFWFQGYETVSLLYPFCISHIGLIVRLALWLQ
jgi:hypothetical protein